jgi:hypothetical protein
MEPTTSCFDYLRDNMAWSKDELVQRGHHFSIVDEVDSILIDEARTPLIISGQASGDVNRWYTEFARVVKRLHVDDDYEVDEKKRTVGVLESGIEKVEDYLGIDNLYESANTPLIGFLNMPSRLRNCSSATRTTSSSMAKSSLSTNTPAESSLGAAITRACTRPLRQKRVWRSRPRTRRWPQSRCRTTSGSTTSCRA